MPDDASELSLTPSFADERRGDHRAATVFRPVLIEAEEFAGFCLVRNLSSTGLMGVVYTQFAQDLPVLIQFNQDCVIPSTVIWSQQGRVGIRFDTAIDVPFILDSMARKEIEGKINRAPRVQLQCNGFFLIGDRSLSINVLDISQRGIKVHSSFVRPGDDVLVQLDGLEPRKAVVRWTQDGTAGLNFIRPLGFADLAEWVIGQQIKAKAGNLVPLQGEKAPR